MKCRKRTRTQGIEMAAHMLTPAQIAERLGVAERTVYRWLRQGNLRGVKVGRRWRIAEGDLDTFLRLDRSGDDPDRLTEDEIADSDAAWRAYVAGDDPGETLDQVRQALLGKQSADAGTVRRPLR